MYCVLVTASDPDMSEHCLAIVARLATYVRVPKRYHYLSLCALLAATHFQTSGAQLACNGDGVSAVNQLIYKFYRCALPRDDFLR